MLQRLLAARENARARRRDGANGFTLIELLIVIVILGVLAAIVVIAVGAFDDRGQDAACKADVKTVEVAVEAYRAKLNSYPPAGDAGYQALIEGGFLRDRPSTENYTIELEADGVVQADCASGGGGGGGGDGGDGEEVPGAVGGLAVGSITTTSAVVSWTAPATGGAPTGYTIEWSTSADFSGATSQTDDTSPFDITGLTDGTTYHVRVAATNAEGTGEWATTSFATTAPAVAPGNVTGLNVGSCTGPNGNRTCTATWTAASGNPTPSYIWQRDTRSGACSSDDFNGGSGYAEGTAAAGATSVAVPGLNGNLNYCFRIRATNSAGQSPAWTYDTIDP